MYPAYHKLLREAKLLEPGGIIAEEKSTCSRWSVSWLPWTRWSERLKTLAFESELFERSTALCAEVGVEVAAA